MDERHLVALLLVPGDLSFVNFCFPVIISVWNVTANKATDVLGYFNAAPWAVQGYPPMNCPAEKLGGLSLPRFKTPNATTANDHIFRKSTNTQLLRHRHQETTDIADMATPQDTPNLHKDEVTGEMVSKSELKKRQKKREADKKKVYGHSGALSFTWAELISGFSSPGREGCRCCSSGRNRQ